MRRYITTLLLLLILHQTAVSQVMDQELLDPNGTVTLLGKSSYKRLKEAPFKDWFVKNEESYVAEVDVTRKLKKKLNSIDSITIFMGTWCGDSKREVPRLTRTLQEAGFDFEKVNIICLDRRFNFYKQSPQHEESGLNIHRVPTILLHKGGEELGRIIEHPVATIEEDLLAISDGNYTGNYPLAHRMDEILAEDGYQQLLAQKDDYLKELKPLADKSSELTTYARTLLTTWRIPESVAVLEFNQQLFPESEYAHLHLASTYLMLGKKTEATACCQKALAINPDSQAARGMMEKME